MKRIQIKLVNIIWIYLLCFTFRTVEMLYFLIYTGFGFAKKDKLVCFKLPCFILKSIEKRLVKMVSQKHSIHNFKTV